MQFRSVVALIIILTTVAADGVVFGMMGTCAIDADGQASLVSACCCGPDMCGPDQTQGIALAEKCCDLRAADQNPETVPATTPRLLRVITLQNAVATTLQVGGTLPSHPVEIARALKPAGSPPLFQLLCTYLI